MSEQGISAIDSLYNYGSSVLTDKYFLQAYQSPNNYYAVQAKQAGATQQAGSATNTQSTDSLKNVNFKGASDTIAQNQEKKSSSAGWLMAGVGTILTGLAAWKCHGKGVGDDIFKRTWDGAKKYWNQGIEAVSKWKFKPNEANTTSTVAQKPLTRNQALAQLEVEHANNIVRNMNRVEENVRPFRHDINQKGYEKFFEEHADELEAIFQRAISSK